MKTKDKHAAEIIIGVAAVAAIGVYFWMKYNSSKSAATNANTIAPATNAPANGVVNVNFTAPATTDGIGTYIPLFGFLRFGAFGA